MGRRTAIKGELYFVTLTVVDWIDVFTQRKYFDLIIANLEYCRKKKGLRIFSYVIMTNHLHMICSSNEESLTKLLGHFKSYTAKVLLEEIKRDANPKRRSMFIKRFEAAGDINQSNLKYQFWQNGSYPVILFSDRVIAQKIDYIHYNPVKAGYVNEAAHYAYSSAHPYSPLEMDLLEQD